MKKFEISLLDILDLAKPSRKLINECEEILKTNRIVFCGKLKSNEQILDVRSVCLQHPTKNEVPFEVAILMAFEKDKKLLKGLCTCEVKTGNCKHILACMLYINRCGVDKLEDLTKTNITKFWGNFKKEYPEIVKSEPVTNFCHFKNKEDFSTFLITSELKKQDILSRLVTCSPDSLLAAHKPVPLLTKHMMINKVLKLSNRVSFGTNVPAKTNDGVQSPQNSTLNNKPQVPDANSKSDINLNKIKHEPISESQPTSGKTKTGVECVSVGKGSSPNKPKPYQTKPSTSKSDGITPKVLSKMKNNSPTVKKTLNELMIEYGDNDVLELLNLETIPAKKIKIIRKPKYLMKKL